MKRNTLKKSAALTVALGVLAQPALAATNITKCQTITKAGSYKLTKDLSTNGTCFKITASGVTLNLGGHTLIGNAGGGPSGFGVIDAGVSGTGRQINLKIRNGTIKGFITAVELRNSHGALIEKLDVRGNNSGIKTGPGAFILSNHVASSNGSGIFANAGSVIEGNTVVDNALSVATAAIVALPGSRIRNNTVVGNLQDGILLTATATSSVKQNIAENNSGAGIEAFCPAIVTDNRARFNQTFNGTGEEIETDTKFGTCFVDRNQTF